MVYIPECTGMYAKIQRRTCHKQVKICMTSAHSCLWLQLVAFNIDHSMYAVLQQMWSEFRVATNCFIILVLLLLLKYCLQVFFQFKCPIVRSCLCTDARLINLL